MNDAQIINKFASDVAAIMPVVTQLAQDYNALALQNAELRAGMAKQASALEEAPVIDEQRLFKAASAAQACFPESNRMGAQGLYEVFKQNPNAIVDCLYKVASELRGVSASAGIGKLVDNPTDAGNSSSVSANERFLDIINNR